MYAFIDFYNEGLMLLISDALGWCCSSCTTLDTYLSLLLLSRLLHASPNEAGMESLFVISAGDGGLSCISKWNRYVKLNK